MGNFSDRREWSENEKKNATTRSGSLLILIFLMYLRACNCDWYKLRTVSKRKSAFGNNRLEQSRSIVIFIYNNSWTNSKHISHFTFMMQKIHHFPSVLKIDTDFLFGIFVRNNIKRKKKQSFCWYVWMKNIYAIIWNIQQKGAKKNISNITGGLFLMQLKRIPFDRKMFRELRITKKQEKNEEKTEILNTMRHSRTNRTFIHQV